MPRDSVRRISESTLTHPPHTSVWSGTVTPLARSSASPRQHYCFLLPHTAAVQRRWRASRCGRLAEPVTPYQWHPSNSSTPRTGTRWANDDMQRHDKNAPRRPKPLPFPASIYVTCFRDVFQRAPERLPGWSRAALVRAETAGIAYIFTEYGVLAQKKIML